MSEPKVWRPGELWVVWDDITDRSAHQIEDDTWVELTEAGAIESADCSNINSSVSERYSVRKVITGDPADKARIAELEGAIRKALDVDECDFDGVDDMILTMANMLSKALQSTEVRDGE